MEQKGLDAVKAAVDQAEFVLVGIGEEFQKGEGPEGEAKNERIVRAYNRLADLLQGKPIL